ncbi:hypothetical protein ACIQVO_27855 [Streptomyces sp. NPDC101062]|uniref:hypothetical protein n=1 Tax=unclassified Streptomyces TaxID=2593676 RepID=UPI003809EE8D
MRNTMHELRGTVRALAVLAALALSATGAASAADSTEDAAGTVAVDHTGVIGSEVADVFKEKKEGSDEWGQVYDTETVHLACKGNGAEHTWYQLAGEKDRWIMDDAFDTVSPGIPSCPVSEPAGYTGTVTGSIYANVNKAKREGGELWGLVYETETVHLNCRNTGAGHTWYQLAGQPGRWIIDYKLSSLSSGIPTCTAVAPPRHG